MAATVRGAIRERLEQTMATMDALLEASDRELYHRGGPGRQDGERMTGEKPAP